MTKKDKASSATAGKTQGGSSRSNGEKGTFRFIQGTLFDPSGTEPAQAPMPGVGTHLFTDQSVTGPLPKQNQPGPQEAALLQLLGTMTPLTADRQSWDIEGTWDTATIPVQPKSVDLNDKQSRRDLRDPNRQVFTPQYQAGPVQPSIIGSQPGEVIFLSHRTMPLFEPFVSMKSGRIKLINWGMPACKLSFFTKHVYRLQKEPDTAEKVATIGFYLVAVEQEIQQLSEKARTASPRLKEKLNEEINALRQEQKQWQMIQDNPEEWALAISNYETGYAYLSVSIKYRKDEGYENKCVHLLHNLRDKIGATVETRLNIIFINEDEIQREHCMQNKQIEFYLQQFPVRSNARLSRRDRLYARKVIVT